MPSESLANVQTLQSAARCGNLQWFQRREIDLRLFNCVSSPSAADAINGTLIAPH
jgi:hypothetical protein